VIARSIVALAVVLATPLAWAEKTLQEFSWSDLQVETRLESGEVVAADASTPFESLVVENTESSRATFRILFVVGPGTLSDYAIRGRVAYEGVEGTGYLEMWSHFSDGRRRFSRTLGNRGPTQGLTGTSDWREFELPFFQGEERRMPSYLIVNVVLPGKGKVRLGPLRLVTLAEPWWDVNSSWLIGAVGGPLMGILCPLVLWFVFRGRPRWLVIGAVAVMLAAAVGAFAVGLAALCSSQPYAIWYPPLLVGGLPLILAPLYICARRGHRKRLEQAELRKMEARDA
jgi:hypothetical protein